MRLTAIVALVALGALGCQRRESAFDARLGIRPKGRIQAIEDPPSPTLFVDKDGFRVGSSPGAETKIPLHEGEYDFPHLAQALKELRAAHADAPDLVVVAGDGVGYKELIRAMDEGKAAGFRDIGLGDKTTAGRAGPPPAAH